MQEFEKLLTKDYTKKNHDNMLDELKLSIKDSASSQHQWDTKAMVSCGNHGNQTHGLYHSVSFKFFLFFQDSLVS